MTCHTYLLFWNVLFSVVPAVLFGTHKYLAVVETDSSPRRSGVVSMVGVFLTFLMAFTVARCGNLHLGEGPGYYLLLVGDAVWLVCGTGVVLAFDNRRLRDRLEHVVPVIVGAVVAGCVAIAGLFSVSFPGRTLLATVVMMGIFAAIVYGCLVFFFDAERSEAASGALKIVGFFGAYSIVYAYT